MKMTWGLVRRILSEAVDGDEVTALITGEQSSSLFAGRALYSGNISLFEDDFCVAVEVGPGGACEVSGSYDCVALALTAIGLDDAEIEAAIASADELRAV